MSDDTDEATGKFIYQPIRFSHEEEQWLELMQGANSLLIQALEAFRIPPELIGETTNYSAGTSQEEVYRRRFGL